MSIERFLGILDRTRSGPVCTAKDWENRVLPTKVLIKTIGRHSGEKGQATG